jgi:hypothetical protein
MIPKSLCYKLVNKSDNIIIAEGNAKDMMRLRKRTPKTFVGLGMTRSQIGDTFGNDTPYTLIQKTNTSDMEISDNRSLQ